MKGDQNGLKSFFKLDKIKKKDLGSFPTRRGFS